MLVVPLVVIGVAGIGGQLAGDLTALLLGTAVVVLAAGMAAHWVLGKKWRWKIIGVLCLATVFLLFLGMIKIRATEAPRSTPSSSASNAEAPMSTRSVPPILDPPSDDVAGRRLSQEQIMGIADFRGADLRGTQLSNLNLEGIDFSGANAAGASFEGSDLERTSFRGANLGGANLRDTCLRNADLNGADLTGVSATNADLTGSKTTPEASATALEWPTVGQRGPACD